MYTIYEVWKFVLLAHFILICCAGDIVSITALMVTWIINVVIFSLFSHKYIWMGD